MAARPVPQGDTSSNKHSLINLFQNDGMECGSAEVVRVRRSTVGFLLLSQTAAVNSKTSSTIESKIDVL